MPHTPHPRPMMALKSRSLKGEVRLPGDKSISHRALMISSQAVGTTEVEGLLEAGDVMSTASALRALGVSIDRQESGRWRVRGVGIGGLQEPADVMDMGNSGTSTRLLMGLVASYGFNSFFTGDVSLRKRPMQRAMTPLEQMGAQFLSRSNGRLPLVVRGNGSLLPIRYESPIASAQIKSCIMLAALNTAGRTTVIEPQLSRDHTERMLQEYGVEVETVNLPDGRVEVSLQGHQEIWVKDKLLVVPGDPSSAAFLAVAALITPDSHLVLRNICLNPQRTGLYDTLKEMGGDIRYVNERIASGEPVADIEVRSSELKGITVPAERAPSMIDEYPILAIAAACAKGRTVMQGLEELKVKESNRLAAIHEGLAANGATMELADDTLTVVGTGKPPAGGGKVATHHDHRIAMSFLVLGLVTENPVTVDDITAVATSFPSFVPLMQAVGALIEVASVQKEARVAAPVHQKVPAMTIAIDGPAASGKGTLARRLASYLGFAYLDTGRLYRAAALRLALAGGDATDEEAAVVAAGKITEEDLLNPRLRDEKIGRAASIVSSYPKVRELLLEYQREFAKRKGGAILDGRDIGTVICPEAQVKLFITADREARAKRRWLELQGNGQNVTLESVLREIEIRDQRDSERAAAPLKPAEDAIYMDTTATDANDVFVEALEHIYKASGVVKAA